MNEYELIHLIVKDASWAGATIVIALSMKPIISILAKWLEQGLFKNGRFPSFSEVHKKLEKLETNDLSHIGDDIAMIKSSLQSIDRTLIRVERHEENQTNMLTRL